MILEFTEKAELTRDNDGRIWVYMTFNIKNPELTEQAASYDQCLLSDHGSIEACLDAYRDRYQNSLQSWVNQNYPALYDK